MQNPTAKHNYGVGYLLRNCQFDFDLEEILPQLLPVSYLAKPDPEKPWGYGGISSNYGMGFCRYQNGARHETLSYSRLAPHQLDEDQSHELVIYSLLTLHELIEADGGIQLAPSKYGNGIYKVTNLPGNSSACFFDYVAMGEKIEELSRTTGHAWLALPWDADELYLIDAEEANWNPLIQQIVTDFFIEHTAASIHAAADPSNAATNAAYWLLPRYTELRQFYFLLGKDWTEVPPLCATEEDAIEYLNYRTVATLANYRFGTAGAQLKAANEGQAVGEGQADYVLAGPKIENLEGVLLVTGRLHPTRTTYLPRCDWVFYADEAEPLCRASTLLRELQYHCEGSTELIPAHVRVPPLSKQQLRKLRKRGAEEVADFVQGRSATGPYSHWEKYPYAY